MSSSVFETSLVNTEGYDTIRKGEDVPLRDLDNFVFYTKRKKGTRLVSIEDIEEGEPIYGRGRLMPKKGPNKLSRAIEIELDILDSWALEFCDKLDESGVWIKTNHGWYRLLSPAPEYKFLYDDLHSRFEITLKVFAVLIGPNGSTMVFKDMARELMARHGITDKQLIDNAVFIAKHLRSVQKLDRIGFIRSLEITHAFFNKGLYKLGSAYTSKKKRKFNEVKNESSRATRSNVEKHNADAQSSADESIEEHSKTKRRKLTHNTSNTPTNNLFVTKSRQYHGVKDYSTIPQRYMTEDRKRLHCFVCDQTMRVEEIDEYVKHVTKHRTNLVGEMLDKDRVAFRLQSFINQARVRNFIETALATDTPVNEDISAPLADLPSQVNMTMKARKRRTFYVDARPPVGQVFESEWQPLYDEFHREEEIEEMVVDSTNYKTAPVGNRYGDVSEAQEFEEEIIDEDDEDYQDYGDSEEHQHTYVPYSRDDDEEDDEDDEEDEDFRFTPKTKPKPNRSSGTRSVQRRFASAQQLEKERQKREQKENSRAIEALEVLVAREILDAVETLPAIETSREATLRQDLSMLLLPSSSYDISPSLGNMTNAASNMSHAIESNNSSLNGANDGDKLLVKGNNSPNIALCTANEVMVKQ